MALFLISFLNCYSLPPFVNFYWRIDGTSGNWSDAYWSNTASGPFNSTFTYAGAAHANFTANSTLTFSTINVTNVVLSNNITVTVTAAGTITTAASRTYDIGSGSTLNWPDQDFTTSAGLGIIKNGAGTWNMGAPSNTFNATNSGFTLNAGTVKVSGDNSFGGSSSLLTISGGTIESSGTRSFPNSISLTGNHTQSGTGEATYTGNVSLGASTRTLTNSISSGIRIFSGVISGTSSAGLIFAGTGSTKLNGSSTYPGTTTINGGTLILNNSSGAISSSSNVTVNSGATLQISENQTLNSLTLNDNAILIIDVGKTLTINGDFTLGSNANLVLNGTLTSTGSNRTLTFSALTSVTLGNSAGLASATGTWTTKNFSNSVNYLVTVATTTPLGMSITANNFEAIEDITINSPLSIANVLYINNGATVNANSNITLLSGAKINRLDDNMDGTGEITGSFKVEKLLPANRKYHMMSAPIVGATALQWRDNAGNTSGRGIQITGTGSNFDASTSNNPSAFSWTEANGDATNTTVGTGATSNAGWTAWTNGNQSLASGEAYRVLVRGDRSISLDGSGSVTPNATTIWVQGTNPSTSGVSVGINATSVAAGKGWNLIGNPYPANWLATNPLPSDIDNSFYYFNPTSNSYQTLAFGSDVVLLGQGFFIHKNTSGSASFTFSEADKMNEDFLPGFQAKSKELNTLFMHCAYDSMNYSNLKVGFKSSADENFDPAFDAFGLNNPVVNLSSYDEEGLMYNWNFMPEFTGNKVVPLTLKNSAKGNYTLSFSNLANFDKGIEIFLKDNFLNTQNKIKDDLEYSFTINDEANSGGNNRLELIFNKKANALNSIDENENWLVLYPNPVKEVLNLRSLSTNNDEYSYQILNAIGQELSNGKLDFKTNANRTITVQELPAGIYFLKVQQANSVQIIKFIK